MGWKLDYVLSGKADESFLDTYTVERKDHVVQLINSSVYLGKIICITDPEEAAKRDEDYLNNRAPAFPEFPTLTDGILQRKEDGSVANLAGEVSVQGNVSYHGKVGSLDDFIGRNWAVISIKDDPRNVLNKEQVSFLNSIGTSFVHITKNKSTNAYIDLQEIFFEYFESNGIETLIIRPDFYNFGSTANYNELPQLVDQLRNRLSLIESESYKEMA